MLQNIKVKEEHLFLTAYSLWLIDALFSITMWNDIAILCSIGNLMKNLAYVLLIVQFLNKKTYTKRDVLGLFLIVGTAVIAYHSVYNREFMFVMIFMYFGAEVDFKKILRQTVVIQGVFMAITILAATVGVIENTLWDLGNGRLRYALGYRYCAYSAHILLFITLAWVSMRERITVAESVILLGLNTVLYVLTDSKTDYLLVLLALVGYGVICFMHRRGKQPRFTLLNIAAKYGCGLVTVFSVLFHALYKAEHPVWEKLNILLNNRLRLGYDAIHQYGFSLFGKAVQWYGMGSVKNDATVVYNYVDCAYLKLLIEAGAILVLAMIVGFYLVGKRLVETRQYYLIWSLVISFVYGIVNVHVVRLSFCAFILVLSMLFKRQDTDEETDIASAFGKWSSTHLTAPVRETLRVIIILVILIVVTYIQIQGYDYMIQFASMYRYIVGFLVLLLAACTWEHRKEKRTVRDGLEYALWAFIIVAMISDFFVSRHFKYAAFSMLLFGGIFYSAWRNMNEPRRLVFDFKLAYKIYFIASILFCVVARPMMAGQCYNGLYANPSDQAVAMLIAYVLCMVGMLDAGWGALNTMGSVIAFYLIYRSGQPIILVIALLTTIVYMVRRLYLVCKKRQTKRLLWMAGGCLAGCLFVWCLRYALLEKTASFGLSIEYANEQVSKFKFGGAALFTVAPWTKLLKSMRNNYLKHIKSLNFMGHKYRKKINKLPTLAPSSLITNAYRYGIVAGISYAGVLIAFLKRIIQGLCKEDDMEMAAVGFAMILCCMFAVVELPFLHIGWIVFYFVAGYFVVQLPNKNREKE